MAYEPSFTVQKRAFYEAETRHALPVAIQLAKRRSIHEEEWLDQTRGLSIHSPALSSNAGDVDQLEDEAKELQKLNSHEDIQMVCDIAMYDAVLPLIALCAFRIRKSLGVAQTQH